MTDTAALVSHWRRQCGMSQAELASAAGTGQAAISRIESGHDIPTLPVLERIATALGCSLAITFTTAP
ncbi:helix-turn-helix transcriptional regulator [Streptomyces sp. NPDC004732]|uniref:helix-turn-helix domain-containing protein n=1 Tax=Streptomyces sp. NPDC004732 TaxID=3154290 RepID=UPI0033AD6EF2